MKKLTVICLLFLLLPVLSGCALTFSSENYEKPIETMSPETFTSEEVSGLEPGTYHYLMEETVEDFSSGITTRTEYIPGPEGGPVRTGLTVYENDVEIRREDWQLDTRDHITKNTVTVSGSVTEIWEYTLTYNANLDLETRKATLNGQWQFTEDYNYNKNKPWRLREVLISYPDNDNPPWYWVFFDQEGRMTSLMQVQADEPAKYAKGGSNIYSEDMIYDDTGRLENRRVGKKNGGFYEIYYEKFAYDGNHTTVSRYKDSSHDLILRIEETYDDFGNLLLSEEYSPGGALLRRTTCRYTSMTID